MAYDGWFEYNGVELINLSRTAQLSEVMGIDVLWTDPESVQWIQDSLGGTGYSDIGTAPWYDPGFPASAEFAGIVPLSISGLDDSTLEASTVEYITDGGSSNKGRNKTLDIVANVAVLASTPRGADFGKRWLDRRLRDAGANIFCGGSDLRYFQYKGGATLPEPPLAHRRDVSLSRGTSVTRKRPGSCSEVWLVTFTLKANDPFEYGEPVAEFTNLGDPNGPTPSDAVLVSRNLVTNPAFRSSSGTVVVSRNWCQNPSFETNTTGWVTTGAGSVISRDTAEFSVGTASLKVVTSGLAVQEGAFYSPVAQAAMSAGFKFGTQVRIKGPAGAQFEVYAISQGTGNVDRVSNITLAGTGWETFTVLDATLGATKNPYIIVRTRNIAQAITFYIDAVNIFQESEAPPYFDGSTVSDGTFTYSWAGTAHGSTSLRSGVAPTSWSKAGNSTFVRSVERAYVGDASGRVTFAAHSASNTGPYVTRAVTAGQRFRFSAWVWIPTGVPGFSMSVQNVARTIVENANSTSGAAKDQWVRLNMTVDFTATGTAFFYLLNSATTLAGQAAWVGAYFIEEVSPTAPLTYQPTYFDGDTPDTAGVNYTWDNLPNLSESRKITSSIVQTSGVLTTMTEDGCPVYDYSPIYDPLHPALVPAPEPPDFYPEGWALVPGALFRRFWTRVASIEPSALNLVPMLELDALGDTRYLRVQIRPGTDDPSEQDCAPLWEAIVTYLPLGINFTVDGEQRASYVWDGVSPQVRRADSLVYGASARPINWASFNDDAGLLVTMDILYDADGNEYDGDFSARAALSLVPKSD